MSKGINLLSFDEALAVARRIHSTPEPDLRRVTTGLSFNAIASICVLAVQLDAIARAAAEVCPQPDPAPFTKAVLEIVRANRLHELLRAAGYLPLPETTAQEATDVQG